MQAPKLHPDAIEGEHLNMFHIDAGKHVLKATAVSRNEKSRNTHAGNHIFGLDYLRLKK
jgi:hypothetical protein